jgi:hypothetical protein
MSVELETAFADGRLIRPSDRTPNLVHLVRAIALLAGARDIDATPCTTELAEDIGPSDHLVFVLLDGLGMNLLRQLPEASFLRRNFRRELISTCPSTTACALTSVATGAYASRHGITGWFTYLPAFGISIATLPFIERITGLPLAQRGIRPEDIVPVGPLTPHMTHEPLTSVPAALSDTTYNSFTRGGTPGFGYRSIRDAMDLVINRVREARRPTYTHLYLPEVDSACHRFGVNHPEVAALVSNIDSELERLSAGLAGKARIIVSADHGLLDVAPELQTLLMTGDPLLDLLAVPPSGDARMPIFHVRDGKGAAFAAAFKERFGDRICLVTIERAERLELFGPGELSSVARQRFGDFIGFPFKPASVAYHPLNKPPTHLYRSIHAGLSPEEMQIPLVLA